MHLSRSGISILIIAGALTTNGVAAGVGNSAHATTMLTSERGSGFQQAPDLDLNQFGGGRIRLKDLRGRVVVLNFWATWCVPCRVEIPDLNKLTDEFRGQDLTVIGISWDDTDKQINAFQKQIKLNYKIVLGGESVEAKFGGVPDLPTTFIIDRTGHLRQKLVGAAEKSEFESVIRPLLAEKP